MRVLILLLCLLPSLAGCAAPDQTNRQQLPPITPIQTQETQAISSNCPLTEPIWAKPPDDSAVQDSPAFGHYFVNEDRSIWASAWWTGQDDHRLRVSEEGVKVGWFRPAGATLTITGQRIDGQAPALVADIPAVIRLGSRPRV